MRFGPISLDHALGKLLGHNIADTTGKRVLRKGRALTPDDIAILRQLGRTSVYVAELEPSDVTENEAARRIAQAIVGDNLRLPGAASGRANLLSTTLGVLRVDAARLNRINQHDGITLATRWANSPVHERQMVATVKIIPYAVPEKMVHAIKLIAVESGPVVQVEALPQSAVGLILSGSLSIYDKLLADFAPLRERIERLGSHVVFNDFVALEDELGEIMLAESLQKQHDAGARLILLAGETAIMDRHDIVPRALERAGGKVECVGAPVDPGNLLMLGYLGNTPVLGAPGCARSRKLNIVDWVLPRLLVGDRLRKHDIVNLGHGGLLEEDAPERGIPRNQD